MGVSRITKTRDIIKVRAHPIRSKGDRESVIFVRITKTLGGEMTVGHPIRSRMDFVKLGQRGLTKSSVVHLAKSLSLSMKEMAALLPVTERTLQRKSARQHLSPVVSEQALQIAQVAATGSELFEDREKFLAWLSLPSAPLGGEKPFDLLRSRFGIELVLDELGRIAHGLPA